MKGWNPTMLARIIPIATATLLSACANAPDVQTNTDPQADFSRYRTFVFLQTDPKATGAITDPLAQNRLRNLITGSLVDRGYAPAAKGQTADFGVHYTGHVTEKQSVLLVGRPAPYSYSWGTGRTEVGGYDTLEYRQGTLFVDLVDITKNQLVWRTRISEAFTAGYSDDNWKKVERALDEAFKKLPARR